jgi:Flp pilus assembly protein TadD
MRLFRFVRPAPALIAAALAVQATAGQAQYTAADPATALAQSLKTLSSSPKDLTALMSAGRASLDMGDIQAAAGFFGRAEESYPSSPLPKIGMGAALVLTGDAAGAMAQFDRAQALGAPQSMLALDRGLAFDLTCQQARAQADFKAAMFGAQADEARRRLALSQAISKDFKGAAATLAPLLNRGDRAALRTNAFVLALAGDPVAARRTMDAAMPGSGAGSRFEPFFKMLPILRVDEKAAAVHLGEFPQDAAQRYAMAQSVPTSPTVTLGRKDVVQVASATQVQLTPPPSKKSAKAPVRKAPAPAANSDRTATVDRGGGQSTRRLIRVDRLGNPIYGRVKVASKAPRAAPPVQAPREPATPPASVAAPQQEAADPDPVPAFSEPVAASSEPAQPVPAPAGPAEPVVAFTLPSQARAEPVPAPPATDDLLPLPTDAEPVALSEAKLNADGEPLLAMNEAAPAPETVEAPPPPKPKVERPSKAKIAADKKAKEAAAKALAEKKAKAAESKLGTAGTYWVQLAGGTNADRMGAEFKRISGKQPSLFRGRTPHVTRGKDYFRLVVGPFETTSDAHEFVTKLDKAGIDSFMWTRSPAQIRIDKLASK